MTREALLATLARQIDGVPCGHPTRVAIDGVDAAGKTTLADELVAPLEVARRPIIRASIDSFHNPAAVRYRRGKTSPEGYYRDSFNRAALVEALLAPLGPGGDRQYRRAVFDLATDSSVNTTIEDASPNAVLLFDGVFLLCDELRPFWDFVIFVSASFDVTLARAEARDAEVFGGPAATRQRYLERYIPGQRLYLAEVRPERQANVVVINDDLRRPTLER